MSVVSLMKIAYRRLGFTTAKAGSARHKAHLILCVLFNRPITTDLHYGNLPLQVVEKRYDTLRVAVFSGIGDALWSLLLLPALLKKMGKKKATIVVTNYGAPNDPRQNRNNFFLQQFDFVDDVQSYPFPIHPSTHSINSETGYPDYLPGGLSHGEDLKFCDFKLFANSYLEHGLNIFEIARIYDLDPSLVQTDIFKHYMPPSNADLYAKQLCENPECRYFVFYTSGLTGNTTSGFNRGGLWSISDWVFLGKSLVEYGYKIVFVGASYDIDYLFKVKSLWGDSVEEDSISFVGLASMPETIEIIRHCRGLIGYPSGIPICSTYMGVRTAMFWRPQHLSMDASFKKFGFSREFSTSWVPIERLQNSDYIPLWFGEDNGHTALAKIIQAGWLNE